jgi:tetratricopeptide (TPR) repeat protein
MMIKIRVNIVFVFMLLSTHLFAQKDLTRYQKNQLFQANQFFKIEDYLAAKDIFKALLEKFPENPDMNGKLGICLSNVRGEEDDALEYLIKAGDKSLPETYFYIGECYHRKMDFAKAITNFTNYKSKKQAIFSDEIVNENIDMAERAIRSISQAKKVEIKNLGMYVNSPQQDYAPVLSPNQEELFFTSRRPGGTNNETDGSGDFYEDIYSIKKINDMWLPPQNIGYPLNSSTHDATVSMSFDGKEMLIYRTSPNLTGGDLLISSIEKGKWKEPKKLFDRINSNYQEASASTSLDGAEMFFSSDRPGGFGGKDIYRVVKLPDGQWSYPLNLGPDVNTPYDEDAPFIYTPTGTLYFSSKSHSTIGGYDIFSSNRLGEENWSEPENLGFPINSVKDDIYFTLTIDGETGYFSSDRPEGLGKQDIYEVSIPRNNAAFLLLCGTISDSIANKGLKAKIILKEDDSEVTELGYTNNARSGKYVVAVNPNKKYKIIIQADGYKTKESEINFEKYKSSESIEVLKNFELIKLN